MWATLSQQLNTNQKYKKVGLLFRVGAIRSTNQSLPSNYNSLSAVHTHTILYRVYMLWLLKVENFRL